MQTSLLSATWISNSAYSPKSSILDLERKFVEILHRDKGILDFENCFVPFLTCVGVMTAFGIFLAAIWFGLIVFSLMINNNKRISLSNDKASRCCRRATIKDVPDQKNSRIPMMKTRVPNFRFSRDVTAAMLVYRTIAQKAFWELDSIIMQNLSDILPMFCTPTRPSRQVVGRESRTNACEGR